VLGSIPLIGRLFRSEGERSIKRNLMIFVTATQVDVDGRRATNLALKK
jgi:general secretion pathway protein D